MAGWICEKADLVEQEKEGFRSPDQEHQSEVTLIDKNSNIHLEAHGSGRPLASWA